MTAEALNLLCTGARNKARHPQRERGLTGRAHNSSLILFHSFIEGTFWIMCLLFRVRLRGFGMRFLPPLSLSSRRMPLDADADDDCDDGDDDDDDGDDVPLLHSAFDAADAGAVDASSESPFVSLRRIWRTEGAWAEEAGKCRCSPERPGIRQTSSSPCCSSPSSSPKSGETEGQDWCRRPGRVWPWRWERSGSDSSGNVLGISVVVGTASVASTKMASTKPNTLSPILPSLRICTPPPEELSLFRENFEFLNPQRIFSQESAPRPTSGGSPSLNPRRPRQQVRQWRHRGCSG